MPRKRKEKPASAAQHKTTHKETRKKTAGSATQATQTAGQEENYSIIAGILAGLIIVLGGGLLWSNQQKIIDVIDQPGMVEELPEETIEEDDYSLFIGKEVAASGFLVSDENSTYLSTSQYGIIGLENNEEFGDIKQGSAIIGGTITSFVNNTYFLTINTFVGESLDATGEIAPEVVIDEFQDMVFVAQAGLRFSDLLVNEVSIEPNTNQQFVTIRQKDSKNRITINYFQCIPGHKTYDCKKEMEKLNKSKNLEKAFTTKEGDTIYRIKKTNQRYTSIDDRFGYYISSNSQQFVKEIIPLMDFISDTFIDTYIAPQLTSICTDTTNNIVMSTITSRNQLFFDELLSIDVIGKDTNGKNLQCFVVVDLNNALGGSLISIDYVNPDDRPVSTPSNTSGDSVANDEVNDGQDGTQNANEDNTENDGENGDESDTDQEDNQEDTQDDEGANGASNPSTASSNVQQFPLKLEDPFVHTFNAGYTVSFPSKNISFGSKNVSTDLGLPSTNCTIRTDVIDYPNRDFKHDTPAVNVFVCSTSLEAGQVGNLLYIPSSNANKAYLVKINNEAWVDFANNITIED